MTPWSSRSNSGASLIQLRRSYRPDFHSPVHFRPHFVGLHLSFFVQLFLSFLLTHISYVTIFASWYRYIPHFFYLEFRHLFLTVLRTIKPCSIQVRIHPLIFQSWISHLMHTRMHKLCPHCPSPLPFPSTLSPTLDSYTQSLSPTSELSFFTAGDTSGLCSHALDFKRTSLLTTVTT